MGRGFQKKAIFSLLLEHNMFRLTVGRRGLGNEIFCLQVKNFKKYKSWDPNDRQLFWAALWLAVELLQEPMRGQLKTITIYRAGLWGSRICTSVTCKKIHFSCRNNLKLLNEWKIIRMGLTTVNMSQVMTKILYSTIISKGLVVH